MEKVRLDRWLWATRVFKTRSLSTDACKRNWVKVNNQIAKPSRDLRVGDLLSVRKGPIEKKFQVLGLLEKRISAPKVTEFLEDLTPHEEYQRAREDYEKRKFGYPKPETKGRPSKKQRRDLEEFLFGGDET